jgi:hypothetical protein
MKKELTVILSILTWSFVGTTIIWFMIVLFSDIFHSFYLKSSYITQIMMDTKMIMKIVMIWTLIVCVISMAWVAYNNFLLKMGAGYENKPDPLVYLGQGIPWAEAVISKIEARHILKEIEGVKKSLSVIKFHATPATSYASPMQPHQILNRAMAVMKKGRYLHSLSMLRILLGHPDSSPIMKQLAKIKITECLYELGYEGLANGLAEQAV